MKHILFSIGIAFCTIPLFAQGELDALKYSQHDLRGTARYMSMGGAFGALGGDISTFSQNPAGIGVFRNSEVAATINLSNTKTQTSTSSFGILKDNKFRFTFDNIGYVATFRTNKNDYLNNINIGFAYNRLKSFNRKYKAGYNDIRSSISDYIAVKTDGIPVPDLAITDNYNPYNTQPWLSVLGYESYLIGPAGGDNLYGGVLDYANGGMGNADLFVTEKGRIDEYSFNLGGNILDIAYFGLGIGVMDLHYELNTSYKEYIDWTHVPNGNRGDFDLRTALSTSGTGFNFKLGTILLPTSFWRLGFAFHTPTFYDMTYDYGAGVDFYGIDYDTQGNLVSGNASTPTGRYNYSLQTPWRFLASTAFVIGKKGIISFDYEYTGYQKMELNDDYFGYPDENSWIKEDMKAGHTFKIGGELRVTPQLSVRAGYANQLSPIKAKVLDHPIEIASTEGVTTQYYLDRGTQYYTLGLGYRFGRFYTDAAYVHRNNDSYLYAFSPLFSGDTQIIFPERANLKTKTNSFLFTLGYKF